MDHPVALQNYDELTFELTDDEYLGLFKDSEPMKVVRKYIELVYANPEAPERQVIYMSTHSGTKRILQIYDGSEWTTKSQGRQHIVPLIFRAEVDIYNWAMRNKSLWAYIPVPVADAPRSVDVKYWTGWTIRTYMHDRHRSNYESAAYEGVCEALYNARTLHGKE